MSNITISNQASKIYIYNSADEGVNNSVSSSSSDNSEPKNAFCDVTINFTIPEYHIRIKNNYKNETSKNKHEEMKSSKLSDTPAYSKDSSLRSLFSIDEDVLMKSGDDKLYLGTIVSIKNGKYLVKFDDNTEKWAHEQGLKKLNSSLDKNKSEDPLCVVCKAKNEIDLVEVCAKCSRGYHRQCMSRSSINFSSPWCCDRCTASEIISISDSEDNETEENVPIKALLPYDLKSLKWDSNHRENKEQTYCYCGEDGQWKNKMLRCCKCQQWFHENCISSFKGHLMHGDSFFLFCCKICNDGDEFLQRLELNWKDALHLILFELTITHAQKYYSISKEVVPFIWDKWSQLHFPMEKPNSKERLVKRISQTVKKEDEFKSFGGNNKKKGDFVYLRRRNQPAVSPKINIPSGTTVNERELKKLSIKTFPLNDEKDEPVQVNEIRSGKQKRKSFKDSAKHCSSNTLQAENLMDDSSDENSSKSALDWIIPPPSNFHGINNPFHSQYKPNAKISEIMAKKGFNTKVFEKLPETRIVRTIKRRLSAKDIAFGSNREAKRRKMMKRRKTDEVEIISEIIQPLTMPLPSCIPVRDFYRSENHSEPLKVQKQPKSESIVKPISVENSQVEKQSSGNISLTDAVMNSPIKNKSINLYFGALNRIENGEHFTILAKRWTGGKEEFLLEWDNPTISKTE